MASDGRKDAGEKAYGARPGDSRPVQAFYEVELSIAAKRTYVDLFERAREAEKRGDPSNKVCTTFRMVTEAIEDIIPRDPLNRSYALRDNLSNTFRLRKGRLRICWIASSVLRRVIVLFISEFMRKAGDANDPYRVFSKLLMSGEMDQYFLELGVKKPR
jgi:mRNA-degrading endonuclease RelE of RelBE toxin-antitoxin system